MRVSVRCAALVLALAAAFVPPGPAGAAGQDLSVVYRATLDREAKDVRSHATTCEPEDVWELTSFTYEVRGELALELGPSTVTFGRSGTSVLWSVVVPKTPGKVRSDAGGDETVTSVWFRFHPALVAELFPAATVTGRGAPTAVHWAKRVYWERINDWCQIEAAPCVPERAWQVLTADLADGRARMWCVDTKARSVRASERAAVPPAPRTPIAAADALKAFDGAWEAFDATYAKFELVPDVDWDALRARYRPLAASARTAWDAAGAVGLLVSHLRDLHVGVTVGDDWMPTWSRPRRLNADRKATQASLAATVVDAGHDVTWARTKDDVGYVDVARLSDPETPAAFDAALDALATTWALIVDLRFDGGGDETLALAMAGRIVDRERTYSVNRYRSGPRRTDVGPWIERRCAPSGPWRYASPVIVLTGEKTLSSAESFALMLAVCPHVTSLGDRTGGSSGNPTVVELPGAISVRVPRWDDRTPERLPIEHAGVAPEVLFTPRDDAFGAKDPVVEEALARLRRTPKPQRRRGRRP